MRILNIDGTYFVPEFRRLGHEVLAIGPAGRRGLDVEIDTTMSLQRLTQVLDANGFVPDLVFWCDTSIPPCVVGLSELPAPTIAYSIDQYLNPWHVPYSMGFDLVLVAQKDYLPLFEHVDHPRRIRWFPLFCKPDVDVDPGGERDIPVSFVGTVEGTINAARKKFLKDFKRQHPLYVTQGAYAPVFGRSRIVLNQSAAGELNFRLFEAAACGGAVLTEATQNGLTDLFAVDEEILVYTRGDAASAAGVAHLMLAQPGRLAEIAAAGRDKVLRRHSVASRARTIVSEGEGLLRKASWKQRMKRRTLIEAELAKTCIALATDDTLPLPEEHRRHYAELAHLYTR